MTLKLRGPLNCVFSKPCFSAEKYGAVMELSLTILYPLPSAKAGRAIRIPRCVFHIQKLQPQPTPLKSSLGWHVSSLVGEAEGRPCPKKGVFDENGGIDKNPNMLVFTESGHQIDENDEIDENTLRLAGRGAPPHWCKLELSAQSLAEVGDASAYRFFSNASASSASGWGESPRWPEGEASCQSLENFWWKTNLQRHGLTKTWFR